MLTLSCARDVSPQQELNLVNFFIALSIVNDDTNCGSLSRVELILFKEELSIANSCAKSAATSNFSRMCQP